MNETVKSIIPFLLQQRWQYWWLILKIFSISTGLLSIVLRLILKLNLKKCVCIGLIIGLLCTSGVFAKSYSVYKSYAEQGTKRITAVNNQVKNTLNKLHINYSDIKIVK